MQVQKRGERQRRDLLRLSSLKRRREEGRVVDQRDSTVPWPLQFCSLITPSEISPSPYLSRSRSQISDPSFLRPLPPDSRPTLLLVPPLLAFFSYTIHMYLIGKRRECGCTKEYHASFALSRRRFDPPERPRQTLNLISTL